MLKQKLKVMTPEEYREEEKEREKNNKLERRQLYYRKYNATKRNTDCNLSLGGVDIFCGLSIPEKKELLSFLGQYFKNKVNKIDKELGI